MKAFAYLVFPNMCVSVLSGGSVQVNKEPMEHGIITSVTHGVMSGMSCFFPLYSILDSHATLTKSYTLNHAFVNVNMFLEGTYTYVLSSFLKNLAGIQLGVQSMISMFM